MYLSIWESIVTYAQAMHWAEVLAVITGIIYVVLATKENIWCWPFGIVSSALSVYLFISANLYAESILYTYYIIAGFYGWYAWQTKNATTNSGSLNISTWSIPQHLQAIGIGIVLALLLSYILKNYTDAALPLVDSFTTIFSFIATYMTTRKKLENWLYWIVIDSVSVWLYWTRGLHLYAILMVVYTIMAVIGYVQWQKQVKDNSKNIANH